MNAIIDQAWLAWQVVQKEPALLVFVALLLLGVTMVLFLLLLPTKAAQPLREEDNSRPRLVRDLRRRGKSAGEIARRTGLARDAIALAVAVAPQAGRQSRPAAARSAERHNSTARSRVRGSAPYPMSVQHVR